MLLYLAVVVGSLLFGSMSSQACVTEEAVTELARLVATVHSELEELLEKFPDRDNPTEIEQLQIVHKLCTDENITDVLEQIEVKIKSCIFLLDDPRANLHTLQLGPLDFFSLFYNYTSVTHFCSCSVDKLTAFIDGALTIGATIGNVSLHDESKVGEEMCSADKSLRKVMDEMETTIGECANVKQYVQNDTRLAAIFIDYPTVADYCVCAWNQTAKWIAFSEIVGTALNQVDDAQVPDEMCNEQKALRPVLVAMKSLVDECPIVKAYVVTTPEVNLIFIEHASIDNYCDCITSDAVSFYTDMGLIGQRIGNYTEGENMQNETAFLTEICSDASKAALKRMKVIVDKCPVIAGLVPKDDAYGISLFGAFSYDNIDLFCSSIAFRLAVTSLGDKLGPFIAANDSTGFREELCGADRSKPLVETIKAAVAADPKLVIPPEYVFRGFVLADVKSYASVDEYCDCVAALECMGNVDFTRITTPNQASPWKVLPNFAYICTAGFSCARSGLAGCRSGIAEKFAVTTTNVDRVTHVQPFAAKYCAKMTQAVITAAGECLKSNTATTTVKSCYDRAKSTTSDTGKACDERDCIKDAVKSCGSDALELFIEAVNLYQDDKVKTTDADCGADAISISLLLLATVHILAWIAKE